MLAPCLAASSCAQQVRPTALVASVNGHVARSPAAVRWRLGCPLYRPSNVLSADRRSQPLTPSASPAALLAKPAMLIHLAGALAVRALRVGRMQTVSANRVLEVELAYVSMDDHETLIDQQ